MNELRRTWMVLRRDLSDAVPVQGEPRIFATLVLDAGTGLVLSMQIADSAEASLAMAVADAMTSAPSGLVPGPPGQVLCVPELVGEMRVALREVMDAAVPPITESISLEAEDIFDMFLGHLAGRRQPVDPPGPDDWRRLYEQAAAFARVEPWNLWPDDEPMTCVVSLFGRRTSYCVVVMGNAGIQQGLALYPGRKMPAWMSDWSPGEPARLRAGVMVLLLGAVDELPTEMTAKAQRFGWSNDAGLWPAFLAGGNAGPGELERIDAQRLTVVLAGVLAHHARRIRPAESSVITKGEVMLAEDPGEFRISPLPVIE